MKQSLKGYQEEKIQAEVQPYVQFHSGVIELTKDDICITINQHIVKESQPR